MKKFFILFFFALSITVYGQSDKQKAHDLGMKAIQEMEKGNIDKALDLLKQAKKLDPENVDYPYEMAYAHYMAKEYKKAIKILKGLTKQDNANGQIWQMLGNCYDVEGDPGKAIETYDEGIKQFPNSGPLYLERGNMELRKEEYNTALSYYERGIELDPRFPSNYFWASKIYMSSGEKVWGVIYGEIFMNLERNTKRTSEISALLYETYANQITISSDTSASVSFCKEMTMTLEDLTNPDGIKLPFCMIYEPTLLMSVVNIKTINLNTLDIIRTNFVENYYNSGQDKKYPNILFDYQKRLMEAGHLEAYNHWILMKGDGDAYDAWHKENEDKLDSFVDWFIENPIPMSDSNHFYRNQY